MPKVGPFLNCSQAETKRPSTVMGTVPKTMPSMSASRARPLGPKPWASMVAETFKLLPMSKSSACAAGARCSLMAMGTSS